MASQPNQSASAPVGRTVASGRRSIAAPLVIIAFAAILRWPGMFTAFWLDEIWSLELANRLTSTAGVLTDLHHDNNHHLNTLWLYALGPRDQWWSYRIPSLFAGIATVALAWIIARRRGRLEALFASILFAGSYPLIHFSSEARGYALAISFALGTWLAAQRYVDDRRWRPAIVLWVCMAMGFLSHLTFVHVYVATLVWMISRVVRSERDRRHACVDLLRGLGPPTLLLVALYLIDLRHIVIGGGPIEPLAETLVKTASLTVGGPSAGVGAVVAAVLAVGLCAGGLVGEKGEGRTERPFLVTVVFLSPAVLLIVVNPVLVYFRYFLISLAFALFACAYALADISRRGRPWQVVVAGGMVAYLLGNAIHVRQLNTDGRGGYLQGLQYIVDHSAEPRITVASDYDFRNNAIVAFYHPYLPPGKVIEYLPNGSYPPEGPMWVILHRLGAIGEVEETITPGKPPAPTYRLEKVLPSSELSGWAWLLYRRVDVGAD